MRALLFILLLGLTISCKQTKKTGNPYLYKTIGLG